MTAMNPWGSAFLYVPGDRPDRIQKALQSQADAVIIDLEDAVDNANKDIARQHTTAVVKKSHPDRCPVGIRINGWGSNGINDDLVVVQDLAADLAFIIIPMVNDADEIRSVIALIESAIAGPTPPLIPLLESARGIFNSAEIASIKGVMTLALGPADLSRELNLEVSDDETELLFARSTISFSCSAAGCLPPIDGPYLNARDNGGLEQSAHRARRLGFGGKQAIHPGQLETIQTAFGPSAANVTWATKVIEAFSKAKAQGNGAIKLDDGTFVDAPVAQRAQVILDRARGCIKR